MFTSKFVLFIVINNFQKEAIKDWETTTFRRYAIKSETDAKFVCKSFAFVQEREILGSQELQNLGTWELRNSLLGLRCFIQFSTVESYIDGTSN